MHELLLANRDTSMGPELSGLVLPSFEQIVSVASMNDLHSLGEAIVSVVDATLPHYSNENGSPVSAMITNEGATHCGGRAALVHALAAPYLQFNSHIAKVQWSEKDSHFFNVITNAELESEESSAIFIENWTNSYGTGGEVELIKNPYEVSIVDPLLHVPIYEGAFRAARSLGAVGNTLGASVFELVRLFQKNEYSEQGGDFILLPPEDVPPEHNLGELDLELIGPVAVMVYDPISSNDIADSFSFPDKLAA